MQRDDNVKQCYLSNSMESEESYLEEDVFIVIPTQNVKFDLGVYSLLTLRVHTRDRGFIKLKSLSGF